MSNGPFIFCLGAGHLGEDEGVAPEKRRDVAVFLPLSVSIDEEVGLVAKAEHGEDAVNMLEEHCSAHKDNVYWMVMAAN